MTTLPLLRNYYHLKDTVDGAEQMAGCTKEECLRRLGLAEDTPAVHAIKDDIFMLVAHRMFYRMSGILKVSGADAVPLADFLWTFQPRTKGGEIGRRELGKTVQNFLGGISFVSADHNCMIGCTLYYSGPFKEQELKDMLGKDLVSFVFEVRKLADSPYGLLLKAYAEKSFVKVVKLAHSFGMSVAQLLQIFDIHLRSLEGSAKLFGVPALIVNENVDLEFTKKGEPFLSEEMPAIMNYYSGVLQRAAAF